MYESPIEVVFSDLVSDAVKKTDEYIVECVQQVGVNVDKDELVKALEFDRGQYEKGWNDRDSQIVRCKDCRFSHMTYSGECKSCDQWVDDDDFHLTLYLDGDFYCAFGERREDGKIG